MYVQIGFDDPSFIVGTMSNMDDRIRPLTDPRTTSRIPQVGQRINESNFPEGIILTEWNLDSTNIVMVYALPFSSGSILVEYSSNIVHKIWFSLIVNSYWYTYS